MTELLTGNQAFSRGIKLARVQVISAFPITPQTSVVEELAQMHADGDLQAQYIRVESEHSSMACVAAASMTGVRTFTATSSHGLAYMHEMLHWASGSRLPIVMVNVNRAIGAPWNIWFDQSDSLSQRDTGWIQLYACDHQQIIDTVIKAFHLAETVSIPVMVCYDGSEASKEALKVAQGHAKVWKAQLEVANSVTRIEPLKHTQITALIPATILGDPWA